jgi:hypothetical protein
MPTNGIFGLAEFALHLKEALKMAVACFECL